MDREDEALESLIGKCDLFKVIRVTEVGAFVNCGLAQDVFVPLKEQLKPMIQGESHLIFVFRDEQKGRITGSMKLNSHIYEDAPENVKEGDAVDLLIYSETNMAYKAVVNGDSWGVLYKNEVFQKLKQGQKIKGYIKRIRPDWKIDLMLNKPGFQSVPDLSDRIINHLKVSGGSSPLNDQTPPEEIYKLFSVSKKKFKMALGNLYKKRLVILEKGAIKLFILFLLIVLPSNSHAGNIYDFVVGGTIKNLAKMYVKTANLPKLKEKYIKTVKNMREDKFQKYFMKFFVVYKQLPPDLKQSYVFTEKTSKTEVIGMIDRVNKRDLMKIINKIPSDFIVTQTKQYSRPPKDGQVNETFLWSRIIQKI